jgi:hypothetical protein
MDGKISAHLNNEYVEDLVGAMLVDTASINLTYNDVGGAIYATVLPAGVDHNLLMNYVADQHVAHSGVVLTAGAGLTGGGDITISRTFAVGAGTGITVNADDVAITATGVVAAPYTYASITVNAQGQLTAASSGATPALASLTLTAGAGLTGGGDLSANRTFAVGAGTGITVNADDVALSAATIASLALADTSVQPARTLTAGAGLTGGGSLAADRTFDVGAGTGITVNANDVQIAAAYLGANPTASVGLAAVNGVATSYMRSDAAPALSQSIAPTWTGIHTFTPSPASGAGGVIISPITGEGLNINGAADEWCFQSLGSTTTGQSYGFEVFAGTTSADLCFRVNSAAAGHGTYLVVRGDGVITFGNTTANPAYNFTGTGTTTFGGLVVTVLSATGGAGFRLPHGAAPTSPVNGDMWTTTAGLFVRINGTTIGPLT